MNSRKLKSTVMFGLILLLVFGLSLTFAPMVGFKNDSNIDTVQAAGIDASIFTFASKGNNKADVALADKTATFAVVPATTTINGVEHEVTGVALNGFANSAQLEVVRLPKTIKTIGAAAFMNCGKLESITMPEVVEIGASAFAMTNLEYLIIPSTTTTVQAQILRGTATQVYARGTATAGWNAQWNAQNSNAAVEFNSLFVPPIRYRLIEPAASAMSGISTMSNSATFKVEAWQPLVEWFGSQNNTCLYIPDTIPEDDEKYGEYAGSPVVAIDDFAFSGNAADTITIAYSPNGGSIRVGAFAFNGCTSSAIIINRDIEFASDMFGEALTVFAGAAAKTIVLPNSLEVLPSGAFADCKKLTDIHFIQPTLLTQEEEEELASKLISTRIVVLPDTLTAIGDDAFARMGGNIDKIYIPNTVTHAGKRLFWGWDVPQEVHIGYVNEASLPTTWDPEWKNSVGSNSIINFATPQSYDITYILNGGSHTGNPASYSKNDNFTLNNATRTGYFFDGWFDESGSRVYSLPVVPARHITLTANWTAYTFTIKYEANKPSKPNYSVNASSEVTGTTATSNHEYGAPKQVTGNGYLLRGWTFVGWNTAADGSGKSYAPNYIVPADWITQPEDDGREFQFFAQWTPNMYSVVYQQNTPDAASAQVSGNMSVSNHFYDHPSNLSNVGYILQGWSFAGWNTKEDGTGQAYANLAEIVFIRDINGETITSGTATLFAQWTPNKYTVTFDLNGGTSATPSPIEVTYDSEMPTGGMTVPVRNGYDFIGYFDTSSASGGTQYYRADMSSARKWNKTNATLYARWQGRDFTVTLNNNGGVGGTASVLARFGSAMPSGKVAPTRNGATFKGYYDGYTRYYDENMNSVRTWDKTQNYTLVASWEITISFNSNGGSAVPWNMVGSPGESFYLFVSERPGYYGTWDGYSMNASYVFNSSITLNAVWTERDMKVAKDHYLSTWNSSKGHYSIWTKKQLSDLRDVQTSGQFYYIENDIDLGDWTPIPVFEGTLDGGYFTGTYRTLTMKITDNSNENIGFVRINRGTIHYINIKGQIVSNTNTTAWRSVGMFAGQNEGIIDHCSTIRYFSGEPTITYNSSTDTYTLANFDILVGGNTSTTRVGGIAGKCFLAVSGGPGGRITNCTNNSTIVARGDMGGIVGDSAGLITGCVNNGRVSYLRISDNRSIGGIVGYQTDPGWTMNCTNNGLIKYELHKDTSSSIKPNMGQIVGHRASGTVTNNSNGSNGFVDTGTLHKKTDGFLGIGNYNQLEYAGNRLVGRG